MLADRLRSPRLAAASALGLVIGVAQYVIDVHGMRAAGRAEGLAGIGVAAVWCAVYLGCSLVLLAAACRVLRVPLWAASALGLCLLELIVVAVLWNPADALGLHGDTRAALFPLVAVVLLVAATLAPRASVPTS